MPDVAQGEQQPPAQQPFAHWRGGAVYHIEQRAASLVHCVYYLEVPDREFVEPHVAFLVYALNRRDVPRKVVLRHAEVLQYGAGCRNAVVHIVDSEAFEGLHAEMFKQFFARSALDKRPVVEFVDVVFAEGGYKLVAPAANDEHFLGREVGQQLVDIVGRTFGREELASRDVEQRKAAGPVAEMHCGQEVVFLGREHVVAQCHAGGNHLGYAALDNGFCELGVFELVADGHTVAGTYEFWQVSVERVVGKARHFGVLCVTLVAAVGKGDTQHRRSRYGVLHVGFVKVAATEKDNGIGVLRLQPAVLLHHRG